MIYLSLGQSLGLVSLWDPIKLVIKLNKYFFKSFKKHYCATVFYQIAIIFALKTQTRTNAHVQNFITNIMSLY